MDDTRYHIRANGLSKAIAETLLGLMLGPMLGVKLGPMLVPMLGVKVWPMLGPMLRVKLGPMLGFILGPFTPRVVLLYPSMVKKT